MQKEFLHKTQTFRPTPYKNNLLFIYNIFDALMISVVNNNSIALLLVAVIVLRIACGMGKLNGLCSLTVRLTSSNSLKQKRHLQCYLLILWPT